MRVDWIQADVQISQAWGCTTYAAEGVGHPGYSCYFHEGIDLANGRCLDRVVCVIPGTVIRVGFGSTGYGPHGVQLRIGDGHDIYFGHLDSSPLRAGQQLKPGDEIGRIGTLGNSTGCHLHFEVRPAGGAYRSSVNPAPWLYAHAPPLQAEWRAVAVPGRWEARAVLIGR